MKKILYRIICLVLVFSLCFQPCVQVNARAEKIDLREESSGSAFGYCTAILSGFLASMSVTSSFNVIQLFVRCYLVPTLVKYIVQAMGIKDSKLAAIACVFISTLINSGMDYGASAAGDGAGAAAEGADAAAAAAEGAEAAAAAAEGANTAVAAVQGASAAAEGAAAAAQGAGAAADVATEVSSSVAESGGDIAAAAAAEGVGTAANAATEVSSGLAEKAGDIASAAKDATKSIGGYLGSMKDYFSKAMTFGGKTGLTGALIDATKAAAYTAVKLYVTEALSGTNKQLAKSVGYLAGLGVGFAVEQGLEYATGVVVGGYNEKGPTAEKVTDEKALSDKLAAQRELFLTKMLGEAVCQVVVVAGSYAGVNEDLLTLGGALTKRLTMDYMAKSKKEEELAELQKARNDAANQQNSSESSSPSDGQQQETTNAAIAALDKKIAQKEKELEAFSTENVMKKALLYGVSDLALRKISSYAPSPLQGAQFNLALTSLVQAVAIDEENVVQERDENGENVVRPSEDGKDFGFYGRIIGDSVNQANADFMSMGRGKAKIVGRGEDERLDIAWTSGNDMFFAARYSEYVNDVVNHGTTYAMANQLTSSYHNQAVANTYDVLSGEVNQRYYRNDSSVKPKLAEKYRQYKESITEKIKVLEEAANGMGDSDPRKAALKQFLEKVGNPAEWDVTTWKDVGLWAANVASAGIGSATLVGLSAAGTVGEGSRDNQLSERVTSGSRAAGTMEKGDAVKDLVVALRDEISAAQEVRGQLMSNQSPLVLSAVKEGTVFKDSNGSVIERPDFVGTFSSSDMAAERMKVLKMQEEKKQQGMLKQDTASMKEIREKAIQDFLNNPENASIKVAVENAVGKAKEAGPINNETQVRDSALVAALTSSPEKKEQINNAIKADMKSRASAAADKALAAKGDLQVNAQYQRFIGSDTVYNETWQQRAPVNTGSTPREVAPPAFSKDMFSQSEEGAGVPQFKQMTVEAGAVKQVGDGWLLIRGGDVTELEDNRGYVAEGGNKDYWVQGTISDIPGGPYLIKDIPTGGVFLAQPEQIDNSSSQETSVAPRSVNVQPYTHPVIKESTIMQRPDGTEVIVPQFKQMTIEAGAVQKVEGDRILVRGGEVTELEDNRAYVAEGGDQSYYIKGTVSKLPDGTVFINNIKPGDVTIAEPQPVYPAAGRTTDNSSPRLVSDNNTPEYFPQLETGYFKPAPSPAIKESTIMQRSDGTEVIVPQFKQMTIEAGAVQRVEGDRILVRGGEVTELEDNKGYVSEGGNQNYWVKGTISDIPGGSYLVKDIKPGDITLAQPEQTGNALVQPPAIVTPGRVVSADPPNEMPPSNVNEEDNALPPALKPLPQPASTFSNMQLRKIDPMTGYQKPEAIDEEAVEDQSPSRPKYPEVNLPKMYVPEPSQQQDAPQVRGEAGSLRFNQMTVAPGAVTQVGDGWIQVTGDITNLEPGEQGRQSAYVDAGGSQSYYVQGTVSELPDGSVFIKNIKPGGVTLAESPQPDRSLPAVNLPVYNPKIPAPQNDPAPVEGGVISNTVRKQIPTQDVNPGTEERARQNYEMLLKARDEIQQKKGFIPDSGNRSDLGTGVLPMSPELVPVTAPVMNQASSMSSGGRDFVVGVDPLPADMVAAADNTSPFPPGIKNSPNKIVSDANSSSQVGNNPNLEVKGDGSLSDRAATVMNNAYKNAPPRENTSIGNQPNDERSRQMDVDFNKTKSTTIGPTWKWDSKPRLPNDD